MITVTFYIGGPNTQSEALGNFTKEEWVFAHCTKAFEESSSSRLEIIADIDEIEIKPNDYFSTGFMVRRKKTK